jgi:CheY-like chemotaxis protein
MIVFSVVDSGLGIAPDDIEKLFTDFGMLESSRATWEGTGLGLAICRRLADAMGGEVGVDSELGKGSRFWVKIMLPNAAGVVGAIPENSPATDDPATVLAGLRVLVAEDHDIIRLLTCTNLTRLGAIVVVAKDGVEAVELAAREAFDVVLLDENMPRLDGSQAALQIRNGAGPSAKAQLIGITAHQTPLASARLSNSAFDASLRKPLNFAQLANVLRGMTRNTDPLAKPISEELFDVETIQYLRSIDGGVLLSRAFTDLAQEIADAEGVLDDLIGAGKTADAGKVVHKLAGICEVLGAQKVAAHLRSFEDLASISEADDLRQALAVIKPIFQSTLIALTEAISENEAHQGGSQPLSAA